MLRGSSGVWVGEVGRWCQFQSCWPWGEFQRLSMPKRGMTCPVAASTSWVGVCGRGKTGERAYVEWNADERDMRVASDLGGSGMRGSNGRWTRVRWRGGKDGEGSLGHKRASVPLWCAGLGEPLRLRPR